ncbi:MAG: amino acid adenylation domain-containing protein, partial [Oscillospiraceae bacterium]|nr:amino acid adenylation domain-containing protein [Oscillospiraceae bacterium]
FNGSGMTYDELNKRSNQLAWLLRDRGVKADSIVAIMTERSFEMIIGILGILKAGGAYLPIDPEYPENRIEFMLNDSGTEILLTQTHLYDKADYGGERINLDESCIYDGGTGNTLNLKSLNSSSDLAYVIYTSGSTGRPKGVTVEHKSVVNLLHDMEKHYPLTENGCYLLKTTYIFDVSVSEIFGWFIAGGKLIILKPGYEKKPEKIIEAIHEGGVTHINFVPSVLNVFLDEAKDTPGNGLRTLKYVFAAGEILNQGAASAYYKLSKMGIMENLYGPTEATVFTARYTTVINEKNLSVPIGKPLTNYQTYILISDNKLSPIGVPGELCISGDGLARGYLNRLELTAEKFISNPFAPGTRMYRTGDLARWLPDGNIEFLGRIDNQVKVRGFRIELGEIERRLLEDEDVKEATVVVREDKLGDRYLCAYIVSDSNIQVSELRKQLSASLPDYMMPSYFVQLGTLPLTPSGKVDRKALPEPESGVQNEYVAPRDSVEEILAQVWCEVLGCEKVGINDNFFELGGDSIKAIRIISKMREAGYELDLYNMLSKPTLNMVSAFVMERDKEMLYEQGEVVGTFPLTPIQNWFLMSNYKSPSHFNQAIVLKLLRRIDAKKILKVLDSIVIHHDVLRSIYRDDVQELLSFKECAGCQLYEYDYCGTELSEKMLEIEIEERNNELQASLNISKGPIMKAGLFRTDDGDHLMVCIHHLAVDGVSWRIFIEDLNIGLRQCLSGDKIYFSEKTASYKTWGEALLEYADSGHLQQEASYWRGIAASASGCRIKRLDTGEEGTGRIDVTLNKEDTKKLLHQSIRAFGTEINDLLLSGLGLAMRSFTGQTKISVDLEGHGRESIHKPIAIDRTMGWFTSVYPVMLESSGDVIKTIIETKEMLRRVPNKGMGYGVLKYLSGMVLEHVESDIEFNYLGDVTGVVSFDNAVLESSKYSPGRSIATENIQKSTFVINCITNEGKLNIGLNYRKDRLTGKDAHLFMNMYKDALNNVADTCVMQENVVRTSSDFGQTSDKLSQNELEEILDEF